MKNINWEIFLIAFFFMKIQMTMSKQQNFATETLEHYELLEKYQIYEKDSRSFTAIIQLITTFKFSMGWTFNSIQDGWWGAKRPPTSFSPLTFQIVRTIP